MNSDGDKQVVVTDQNWSFLEPTRPGKARKLINSGEAELLTTDPPMIQLKKSVNVKEKKGMKTIDQYFRDNQEVYIRNVSGGIVSLTFHEGQGIPPTPFTLPKLKKPICLTNYVTKEMIMRSPDFRKLIMRRPPAIELLEPDQYEKIIGVVAEDKQVTPEEIVNQVEVEMNKAQTKMDFKVPESHKVDPESDTYKMDIPGENEPTVSSRIMQLVGDCAMSATTRMEASDALAELEELNLTADDLNYVIGNMSYKTIVSWANRQLKNAGNVQPV